MNGNPVVDFQWFGLKPKAMLAGTTAWSATARAAETHGVMQREGRE
jgi:hypothetical protein